MRPDVEYRVIAVDTDLQSDRSGKLIQRLETLVEQLDASALLPTVEFDMRTQHKEAFKCSEMRSISARLC